MRGFTSTFSLTTLLLTLLLASAGNVRAAGEESQEEEKDTRFFQQGRFFGVSLGLGFQAVAGNRGVLWQGGFPAVDFKLHYWFDFNLALDLGITTAQQFYQLDIGSNNFQRVDVNLFSGVIDVKYYFDTKDLSAPITFSNPYLIAGVEAISKTELNSSQGTTDLDSSIGATGGAGLEFAITPRKFFFTIEGKVHYAVFKDTSRSVSSLGLSDLTGPWFTFTGNILFTW
jgi:hypothetical protein